MNTAIAVLDPKKAPIVGLPSNDHPAPPSNTHGFYLVWCPQGKSKPRKRHATLEEAQDEAERLSKSNPNKSFYVLQTVTVDRTYMECVTIRQNTHFHHEKEAKAYARRSSKTN